MRWQQITTDDGTLLSACIFEAREDQRGWVVIVPAMGIPQKYYHGFAAWLSIQGYGVTTFDYRGSGKTGAHRVRQEKGNLMDWARQDASAALNDALSRKGSGKLIWIGHSLGGQIVPFVQNHQAIDEIITVAAGSGYWRENTESLRKRVWFLWFFLVPMLIPLFGYFPGKRLGLIGNLPRNVMRQWRKWCLHPHYAAGAEDCYEDYAQIGQPILSLSFTDDEFMSQINIESLHGFYRSAKVDLRRIEPADVGLDRIGHFGFFRSAIGVPLWNEFLLPILERDS